jgi:WS/DGAT/MGAT family acyltransferase
MSDPRRERMSSVDTAWLRMDRPGNLMVICGVLLFEDRIDVRRLRKVVAERFLRFARFRQRPVQDAAVASWETDQAFDLDRHVIDAKLRGACAKRALQAFVSRLASRPLPPGRPLWQFHLIENFDGGSAVVARIHHCYADGIALIQVMLSLTDAGRRGPPAMPAPRPVPRDGKRDDEGELSLAAPIANAVQSAIRIGSTLIEKGVELWQDPAKAIALAARGTALTAEIAKLALMAQDSPTRFKGKPGGGKKVAWADPLPLAEVKAVGKALGASVNDVLLACVAGALRGYLADKGDGVDGVMIRALVPVNLRPPEQAHELGNQFGLVFLELPIGIGNPVQRLYALRANMRALKDSLQPVLALGLLAAMGAGPKMLQEQLLDALARNATAVMTNVPGPQRPLYLAGARMESLMFWVPQSGDIGIGVSILSYDGEVRFGLIADRALVPDPERVIARFVPEFEKLVLTALLAPPWHGDLDPALAEQAVAA